MIQTSVSGVQILQTLNSHFWILLGIKKGKGKNNTMQLYVDGVVKLSFKLLATFYLTYDGEFLSTGAFTDNSKT